MEEKTNFKVVLSKEARSFLDRYISDSYSRLYQENAKDAFQGDCESRRNQETVLQF